MRNLQKISIKLQYASLPMDKDVLEIPFTRRNDLELWLENLRSKNLNKSIVYLLTSGGDSEIIITDQFQMIDKVFTEVNQNNMFPISLWNSEIFLQEYESFESAYACALDMRENNPLCYDKDLTELN